MPKRKLTQSTFVVPLATPSAHPWPQEQCVNPQCFWWLEGRGECLNRWNALAQPPEGECPTRYVNAGLLAKVLELESRIQRED